MGQQAAAQPSLAGTQLSSILFAAFYFIIEPLDASIALSFNNFPWPNTYETGYPSRRAF